MPRPAAVGGGAAAGLAALLAAGLPLLAAGLPSRWRPSASLVSAAAAEEEPLAGPGPPPRVHVLSVCGKTKQNMTLEVQAAVLQTMSPADRLTNVCEPGCSEAFGGSLLNVLEMDGSAFPGDGCKRFGQPCNGYQAAQMKFVFGIITEVRKAASSGGPVPEWYLIKDDDTYVNVDGLMAQVCGYSPDDLISFGYPIGCPGAKPGRFWIAGGRGWLVSRALARRLVEEHGDRWLQLQAQLIDQGKTDCNFDPRQAGGFTWDSQVPEIVSWVAGAVVYNEQDLGPTCSAHLGDRILVPLTVAEAKDLTAGCQPRPCTGQRHWAAAPAACKDAPGCTMPKSPP